MRELATRISISLRGNVAAAAKGMADGVRGFARTADAELTRTGRAVSLISRQLDSLGNRYTALLSGAAGLGSARQLVQQESRFTRIGISADLAADEVKKLKTEIYAAARMPDIRLDPSQITSAVEDILEKTGDLDLARDNLRNIGLAIQGSGAQGNDVGAMFADMSEKFGVKASADIMSATDALVNQGKAGAFTLANLATQGSRVMSAYATTGRQGVDAVKEMGAMLQMIRRSVSGPEQAATALEALMRNLKDVENMKKLRANGIQLMDPKQPGVMRSAIDIMKDIIVKTKGDDTKVRQIFDDEAVRAFNAAIIEYKRTGGFESFDKFLNVQSDGKAIIADSGRAAQDSAAALQTLVNVWKQFSDATLSGPIKVLADAINSIDAENLDRAMKALAWGAAAVGGLVVAVKAIQGVRAIGDTIGYIRGGKPGAGGAGGTSLPGSGNLPGSGIIAVRVTNWPQAAYGRQAPGYGAGPAGAGAGAGAGGMLDAAAGRGRLASIAGRAGNLLTRGGVPLALAAGTIGSIGILAGDGSAGEKAQGIARIGGGMAGGLAGAKLGALAGAFAGPAGMLIGSLIGGGAGALLGENVADALSERIASMFGRNETNAAVAVRFENAPPGLRVTSMQGQGADVSVDIGRGSFMGTP